MKKLQIKLFMALAVMFLTGVFASAVQAQDNVAISATDENQSGTKLCLDLMSYDPGSKIVVANCHGGESQRFDIAGFDSTIRVSKNKLCLDGRNGNGRDIIIAQCNGSPSQKWYVDRIPTPWNVPKTEAENGDKDDLKSRRYQVAPGQIQNQSNSQCIDIKYGRIDSKEATMWTCHQGQINRGWNQMFGAAPAVRNGMAYVFLRHYNPAYQGHTGWGFQLDNGQWIAGFIDGTGMNVAIEKGKFNGWFMKMFQTEADMIKHFGGFPVKGQNPEITGFGPYTSYKKYSVSIAHPATAIQVAVRSKDWGYGGFGNNCVDQTVKVMKAYGVPLVFPGQNGTSWQPNTWFGQMGGTETAMSYDKPKARANGCITCF